MRQNAERGQESEDRNPEQKSRKKIETLSTKHETNQNTQIQMTKTPVLNFEHLNLSFVSYFDIRVSDLLIVEPLSHIAHLCKHATRNVQPVTHHSTTPALQFFNPQSKIGKRPNRLTSKGRLTVWHV